MTRAAIINGCGIASYDHSKQLTMKLTGTQVSPHRPSAHACAGPRRPRARNRPPLAPEAAPPPPVT